MIDLFAFVSDKNQISHFSTDSLTFYNLLNYSPGSPYILINEVKLIETQLSKFAFQSIPFININKVKLIETQLTKFAFQSIQLLSHYPPTEKVKLEWLYFFHHTKCLVKS